jgi:hypothetical protein
LVFPVHIEPAFRARKIRVSAISSAAVWNPLAAIAVCAPVSIELRDSNVAGGDMTADATTHCADRLEDLFCGGVVASVARFGANRGARGENRRTDCLSNDPARKMELSEIALWNKGLR